MRFLHLGVYFEEPGAPTVEAIQGVLNGATDWYRYSPNCWLIYTNNGPGIWNKRLKNLPGMTEHASYFICEVNLQNRSGWLRQSVWDWINKDRSGGTASLGDLMSPRGF
jgi:hypothetical protein